MSHLGFRVILQLKTPAILNSMLTLDAVLAAAKYRETNDLEAAHSDLPLAQKNGCWCASAIRLERGAFTQLNWVGRLSAKDMHEDHFTDRNRRGRASIHIGGGTYMPQIDQHLAWAGSVSFEGVGDPEEVSRLLGTLQGLGAKSQQGCGAIESIDWSELDTDGLRSSETGFPLRPVPVELWEAWGLQVDEAMPVDVASWTPPYWGTPKVLCVLPIAIS